MSSGFDYFLKEIIVITKVEFFLVAFLMLVIFFVHYIFTFSKKRRERKEALCKKLFVEALEREKPFSFHSLPKGISHFSLLRVMEDLGAKFKGAVWDSLQTPIIEKILLPRAGTWASSRYLARRSFSARVFSLSPREDQEPFLLNFLGDDSNIIRMTAAYPAGKLGSMRLLQKMVEVMVDERVEGRYPYRDAIVQGNAGNLGWIREQLKLEIDPRYRLMYLDILSQNFDSDLVRYIKKDLESEDEKLRFKALQILERFPSAIEKKQMIFLLEDPSMEIRAAVVGIMGRLFGLAVKDYLVRSLHDKEWWVRFHAVLALKNVGEEGRRLLMEFDPEKDPQVFEMAQYVLSLPE